MMRLSLLFLLAIPYALFTQKQSDFPQTWQQTEEKHHSVTTTQLVANSLVHPPSILADTVEVNETICFGQAYIFDGDTLTSSGQYEAVFVDVNGEDSTVILNLTVVPPPPPTTFTVSLCSGQSYLLGNDTLSATGFYSAILTTAAGCDSMVFLTLTVFPPAPPTEVEATICASETFAFEGQEYAESGVYTVTYTNAAGCDSTLTLNLTVLPESLTTLAVTICEESSYDFYGELLTESGVYDTVFQSSNGCDSTIRLNLTVRLTDLTLLEETFCEGQSFLFNGENLTAPGAYTALLANSDGCDSLVILNLSLLTVSNLSLEASICSGDTYEFNGDVLSAGGVYTALLTNSVGCDSTVTLTLTELPTSQTSMEATICASETFAFEGQEYAESGVYTVTYTNAAGCDSTLTLNLTVLPESLTTLAVTICEESSYDFYGELLTESGVYDTVFQSSNGCDSTIRLNLTVRLTDLTLLEETFCEGQSFLFNGENLTAPGAYTALLANRDGCDSLVILNLSLLTVSNLSLEASICSGDTYEFNGDVLSAGGVYTALLTNSVGCDSTVTLTLTELPTSQTSMEATICASETFAFEGQEYAESGVYTVTYTNAAGCDSTLTLNLTVLPESLTTLAVTICEESSYDFYGELLTESGVYDTVFQSSNGCDSTIRLNLTVRLTDLTLLEETFCEGQSFFFNGENLTAPGAYTALLANSDGCDSLVILNLSLLTVSNLSLEASICSGDTYEFNGDVLSAGGVYTALLTNSVGCDSTVTLTLTELPTSQTSMEATICASETFAFEGQEYAESGVYTVTYTNAAGCDSTLTLNLTVLPESLTTLAVTICEESSYDFYGELLTESGIYDTVFQSSNGCDSTISLNLKVRLTDLTLLEETFCEGQSFLFNGENLTAPGAYTALLANSDGCDSLVILNLSLSTSANTEVTDFFCEGGSYSFNGETLTEPGVYTALLATEAGCDSTVTLTLTQRDPDLTLLEEAICEGQSYEFNGETLSAPGAYTALLTNTFGCDSLVILNLMTLPIDITSAVATICKGETYLFNGVALEAAGAYEATFTNTAGCDSTVTLTLLVNEVTFLVQPEGQVLTVEANDASFQWIDCAANEPIEGATGNIFAPTVSGLYAVMVTQAGCTATSNCFAVTVVSTENPVPDAGWQLFPNPTSGPAQLRVDAAITEAVQLQIFDVAGRLCLQQTIATGKTEVSVDLNNLSDGVFLARLSGGAFSTKMQRIIKVTR